MLSIGLSCGAPELEAYLDLDSVIAGRAWLVIILDPMKPITTKP